MAEVVDDFIMQSRGGGKYRWEEWFDGRVWKMTRGTDFDVLPEHFAAAIRNAGRRKNVQVMVNIRGDDVYLAAMPPNADSVA